MPWRGGRYDGASNLRPGGTESGQTAAQERYPLRHIAILDLDPAAIDRSHRTPEGKPCSVATATSWSARSSRATLSPTSESSQAPIPKLRSQRRRMSQPPSLGDCCVAPCQCLVRKAETEKDNPQDAAVTLRGGEFRPDGQASGGRSDHKAQAPLPDAIGMTQTCRQTAGSDPRSSDPERARRSRCADGSDAANPRPGAAPNRVRRGST